ncbi:hypothetical protein AVEN_209544-1 [Araneus ventricosus]|uniref:Uncharacterized protein n=1 Tax=Araneus ventricosus TaxID=182803 RepID=A0A4Y2FGD5_ARAVE|nr:hypothetical protein AVEN_209544-1 [Araneus ventricosus]
MSSASDPLIFCGAQPTTSEEGNLCNYKPSSRRGRERQTFSSKCRNYSFIPKTERAFFNTIRVGFLNSSELTETEEYLECPVLQISNASDPQCFRSPHILRRPAHHIGRKKPLQFKNRRQEL